MAATVTVPASGPIYARVDGVGNGTPSSGYDDYGSLGRYTLELSGCGAVTPSPTASPTATPTPTTAAYAGGPLAATGFDATGELAVALLLLAGGAALLWGSRRPS